VQKRHAGSQDNSATEPIDSRLKLLEAAIELFAERGYHETTIDAVAIKAGISRGSIFWHFGSKDDLLRAVVEEAFARSIRQLDELTKDLRGLAALARYFSLREQSVTGNLAMIRLGHVLMGEALAAKPELAPSFLETFDRMSERLSRWLEEAAEDEGSPIAAESSALARLILFATYGATEFWLLDPSRVDVSAAHETLRRVVQQGVGAQPSRSRRT
jgi:TetR/AcrR family acrAB operon transcriptional repressor